MEILILNLLKFWIFNFQFYLPESKHIVLMRLHEIPVDVLQLIFEQIKLSDLLRIIESDAMLVQPAIWVFRHTHAHQLIKINGPNFFLGKKFNVSIGRENDLIEIQDYTLGCPNFLMNNIKAHNLKIDT